MTKKQIRLLISVFALLLGITFSQYSNFFDQFLSKDLKDIKGAFVTPTTRPLYTQIATVTEVIDGDTIKIDTGQTVRYIGVDTPELNKPNTPIQCFAIEAYDKNRELVQGKRVRLIKDVSETDRYGRLLRYVYIRDENTNGFFVNEYLVREGFAYAVTFPPDVKNSEYFSKIQNEAQKAGKGLWSRCN